MGYILYINFLLKRWILHFAIYLHMVFSIQSDRFSTLYKKDGRLNVFLPDNIKR